MCSRVRGAKIGLLVCSILLLVIALVCLAGGVVLVLGRSVYGAELSFLKQSVGDAAANFVFSPTLDTSLLDVIFVTIPLGAVLIIFGLLISIICILGIIGSCGQYYKFIIVYLVLTSCLFFMQIVIIICAYIDKTPFDSTVKDLLKLSLSGYTGDTGTDSLTLGWNAIMTYKKCCGVDGYSDFSVATGWSKQYKAVNIETPIMCCITKTPASSLTCAITANFKTETYYNRGCYEHIWDYVTSDTGLILFTVFFIVVLEFLCIFFAAWLICNRRSKGITKVGDYSRYN
ncbi:tetraspanin-9 [Biomphalaria pfeifferi]|uniref:Tetraspanin n=1 Tax=Biomphalaria pfeifferi TaxID=112525 RepID=A0AAD8B622_BIOPF|nr:tetraspanin-9 [Biomphalaria pfeifferi]